LLARGEDQLNRVVYSKMMKIINKYEMTYHELSF